MALHSPDYPVGVGIVTRLMLAKELRGGGLATRMIRMAYRVCLQQGVRHAYIDCNAHLTALFLRCGFVAHIGKSEHPEYGLVQPMRLDLHDEEHLERVGSPFLPLLRTLGKQSRSRSMQHLRPSMHRP